MRYLVNVGTTENTITEVAEDDDATYLDLLTQRQTQDELNPGELRYGTTGLNDPRVTPHSGGGTTIDLPFTYDVPALATGVALYHPTAGSTLLDAWVEIDTAWQTVDGGALIDVFTINTEPWWVTYSGAAMLAEVADTTSGGLRNASSSQTSSRPALSGMSGHAGHRFVPAVFLTDAPVQVCVSQDGNPITTASSLLANNPPTLPLTVAGGVNDQFVYTSEVTASPTTFTIAPGTYNAIGALIAAMEAAHDGSSNAFSTVATGSDSGGKILLTEVITPDFGAANGNSDTMNSGGTDVLADLGIDDSQAFAGGTGGPVGATQGSAVLRLIVS